MYQRTFILDDDLTLPQMYSAIAEDERIQSRTASLAQVFEPHCDRDLIMQCLQQHRENLPGIKLVGATTLGPIGPETHVPRDPMVSLLCFDESEFDIYLYDCHDMDVREAGRRLCEELVDVQHVKGVLLYTANVSIVPTPLIEELQAVYPDISVFGAQAGTEHIGNDQSMVFTEDAICDKGVLAVVFHGENLHITTDYNLGWRPIGREMTITEMHGPGYVSTIDSKAAVDVYRKYLGIELDRSFYANVCAFPLLTKSGERTIARVPTRFTDEGAMQFPAMLKVGSKVRLSYTKPDYLLQGTLDSANEMARFAPQAVLLFACVNRRVYMGNDRADHEIEYYRHICPQLGFLYGFGEILRTSEGGELLNSTIVAAGMREGAVPEGRDVQKYVDPELVGEKTTYRLLSDRLATFIEATTIELDATIKNLESIVQFDQLTGAYNRRFIDQAIAARLGKRRRRTDQGIALLMLDIDHFKNVNDTFGHTTGDVVLKELTKRVQHVVRDEDVVGRWGGEEFLVLVSGVTLENATSLAERIRKYVSATEFPDVGTVTISLGVTTARDEDTPESLFARVDHALYEAKDAGRNCVVAV